MRRHTLHSYDTRPRYASLAQHISLFQYDAFIPESYTPVSEYDAHFGTKPPHEWDNIERGLSFGAVTISQMIELHSNRMKFIICNAVDREDILNVLKEYFSELATNGDNSREVILFKELATAFYASVYDEYRRDQKRAGKPDPEQGSIKSMLGRLMRLGVHT